MTHQAETHKASPARQSSAGKLSATLHPRAHKAQAQSGRQLEGILSNPILVALKQIITQRSDHLAPWQAAVCLSKSSTFDHRRCIQCPQWCFPPSQSAVTPLSEKNLLLVGRLFGDSQELPRESFWFTLPSLLPTMVSSIALSNECNTLDSLSPWWNTCFTKHHWWT